MPQTNCNFLQQRVWSLERELGQCKLWTGWTGFGGRDRHTTELNQCWVGLQSAKSLADTCRTEKAKWESYYVADGQWHEEAQRITDESTKKLGEAQAKLAQVGDCFTTEKTPSKRLECITKTIQTPPVPAPQTPTAMPVHPTAPTLPPQPTAPTLPPQPTAPGQFDPKALPPDFLKP